MIHAVPSNFALDSIRRTLISLEGQELRIRANLGRSRITDMHATLEKVHPHLFTVSFIEHRGQVFRQSFQFVDILTGSVGLYNLDTGEPYFAYTPTELDDEE